MDKLESVLVAEAHSLDCSSAEYERMAVTPERRTAIIMLRAMAAAKRAAAAALSDSDGTR